MSKILSFGKELKRDSQKDLSINGIIPVIPLKFCQNWNGYFQVLNRYMYLKNI